MNAQAAAQIALSRPISPQVYRQLDIVYELIRMAASEGKFTLKVQSLLRDTKHVLQEKGYFVDPLADGTGSKISWEDKQARVSQLLRKMGHGSK